MFFLLAYVLATYEERINTPRPSHTDPRVVECNNCGVPAAALKQRCSDRGAKVVDWKHATRTYSTDEECKCFNICSCITYKPHAACPFWQILYARKKRKCTGFFSLLWIQTISNRVFTRHKLFPFLCTYRSKRRLLFFLASSKYQSSGCFYLPMMKSAKFTTFGQHHGDLHLWGLIWERITETVECLYFLSFFMHSSSPSIRL